MITSKSGNMLNPVKTWTVSSMDARGIIIANDYSIDTFGLPTPWRIEMILYWQVAPPP